MPNTAQLLPTMVSHMARTAVDKVLEGSVVGSFTKVGYDVRSRLFDWDDPASGDVAGRVVVVTGGNSGLGLEAATELARAGATVELVARNRSRGQAAVDSIHAADPGSSVTLRVADMADLGSVRTLGRDLAAAHGRIDAVLHNAGAIIEARTDSPQGIEATLAAMVVGPQLLTHLLLEPLDAAVGRVVWMTSGGMYSTALHLDDLQFRVDYDGTKAYARSKRAQVDLVAEWARRHRGPTTFHAAHPGWADTPGVASSLPTFHRLVGPLLRTPRQGVDTAVWLLCSPTAAASSGLLWFDRRPRGVRRLPSTATSEGDRARLWDEVEALTERS